MILCSHLCNIGAIEMGLKSVGSVAPSDLGRKTVRDLRKGLGVVLRKKMDVNSIERTSYPKWMQSTILSPSGPGDGSPDGRSLTISATSIGNYKVDTSSLFSI